MKFTTLSRSQVQGLAARHAYMTNALRYRLLKDSPLVDDNAQIRSLIKNLLSRQGFPVIEAHDGPTALATLRSTGGAVGALLTDIDMNGMSGIELAGTTAIEFPTIPILMMSASEITEEELRCALPSYTSFVRKRLTHEILFSPSKDWWPLLDLRRLYRIFRSTFQTATNC